jgi:hypothetical protein
MGFFLIRQAAVVRRAPAHSDPLPTPTDVLPCWEPAAIPMKATKYHEPGLAECTAIPALRARRGAGRPQDTLRSARGTAPDRRRSARYRVSSRRSRPSRVGRLATAWLDAFGLPLDLGLRLPVGLRHSLSPDAQGLRIGVARQEDVGTVIVVRHAVGGGIAGGVRRNATPRLRVPGVEAYVLTHLVVHPRNRRRRSQTWTSTNGYRPEPVFADFTPILTLPGVGLGSTAVGYGLCQSRWIRPLYALGRTIATAGVGMPDAYAPWATVRRPRSGLPSRRSCTRPRSRPRSLPRPYGLSRVPRAP